MKAVATLRKMETFWGELNCTKVGESKGELLTGSGKDVLLGDGITAKMEVYYPAFTQALFIRLLPALRIKLFESQINKLIEDELTEISDSLINMFLKPLL